MYTVHFCCITASQQRRIRSGSRFCCITACNSDSAQVGVVVEHVPAFSMIGLLVRIGCDGLVNAIHRSIHAKREVRCFALGKVGELV